MKSVTGWTVLLSLSLVFLCCQSQKEKQGMIEKKPFGRLPDGTEAFLYTLTNPSGMRATITDFGAAVVSLFVPDRDGKLQDVVLGYDSVGGYEGGSSYFGAIVGRYGNRIGKGTFALDGSVYHLTINNGENHLHGGTRGFHKVLWKATPSDSETGQSLTLTYTSPDGDEGYPGNVTIKVVYTLTNRNELVVEYSGTTDRTTVLNPTHHSYFNLTGSAANTILGHLLEIKSDSLTPVDSELITTGEIIPVAGTPMDFRTQTAIGARINDNDVQLLYGKGYDHNWVLRGYTGKVREVAEVYEPHSGRLMKVLTDQPGLQFYSGNFLDGSVKGKESVVYQFRTGFCLEAQHYPDSPNKPQFPPVVVKPGETYRQTTIYHFSTK